MVEVRLRCGRVGFARTADVKEGVGRREGVGPDVGIGQQCGERPALVVVGDDLAHRAPQPCDPVALRVVAGGVDEDQPLVILLLESAEELGAAWGVDAQVVQDHDGDPAARRGALDRAAELSAAGGGAASGCEVPVEPAVAPIHQAKADLAVVAPRGLDQALAAPGGCTPDTGEGRVHGDVDFVLQGDVRSGHQLQQVEQTRVGGQQQIGQRRIGQEVGKGRRR